MLVFYFLGILASVVSAGFPEPAVCLGVLTIRRKLNLLGHFIFVLILLRFKRRNWRCLRLFIFHHGCVSSLHIPCSLPVLRQLVLNTELDDYLYLKIYLAVLLCLTLKKFTTKDPESLCVCVCLSVCVSLASDSSETNEVILIKLGKVTASDIVMHHMIIILTLTFNQSHTYPNHENNKCSIIS